MIQLRKLKHRQSDLPVRDDVSQFKSKFILYFYPTFLDSIFYYFSSYCKISYNKVIILLSFTQSYVACVSI